MPPYSKPAKIKTFTPQMSYALCSIYAAILRNEVLNCWPSNNMRSTKNFFTVFTYEYFVLNFSSMKTRTPKECAGYQHNMAWQDLMLHSLP